ncbi:MAG: multiheme c-type cytochrome [Promethearchaeota archaeon]
MCHNSKKSGQQFKIWQSSAHAKAYRELTSEKANAVAQELGIDNPQTSEKCLKCHGTTGGKDLKLVKEGVGCENCHGPGSLYKSMKVMKDIATGKTKPEDFGMIKAGEEQCKECHNQNSPTYKEFDFKTFWAKIAHPRPTE